MVKPEVLDQIIADFQASREGAGLTPRRVELPAIPGKVDVITGMRRSGKSSLMRAHIERLVEAGVPRRNMLYIEFEDERLARLELDDLQEIPRALHRRSEPDPEHEIWYFFDEIQNVEGWERFVRRLSSTRRHRMVVSGSSAKMLSREIATSMRGRSLTTELMPFGFDEFLRHHGVQIPEAWPPPESEGQRLAAQLDRYFRIGGFPEVQSLDQQRRIRVLQEYLDVALFRDVVERHEVTNVTALKWLLRRLVSSPGGRFSINRFHNDLKSQGVAGSKDLLYELLTHLEDAFLIGTTPIATESENVRRSNPRKAYVVDHVLSPAVTYRQRDDGHLLENMVYVELRRRGFEMAYVDLKGEGEVDFLARSAVGETLLVQACDNLYEQSTRNREVSGLQAAMAAYSPDQALIITRNTAETIEVDEGTIRVIPAWTWLATPGS